MRHSAEKAKSIFHGIGDSAEAEGARIDAAFVKAAKQIGGALLSTALARQVATIRGEFQQLEVAFTTLLQSESKANKLMSEAVDLAAKTPFDLQGVASGARQLLAYGFAADDVIGTLRRLGDVAAGLGLPLQRLTYLYGTTAVQGRLYARDMLQFTSSGIPVLQEMAKMYGKTTQEINTMVSDGKIGFADVKKVIEKMTNAGGQFYNLMENQSKTIHGQISNLQDAIDVMFNNIGKSNEGIINTALSSASYLVEHYQAILNILSVLIATYGSYKAALIMVAAWQKASVTASSIKAFFDLAKGITSAKDAMLLLNIAFKSNTIGLVVGALATIISSLIVFSSKSDDAARSIGAVEQKLIDEQAQINALARKLTDANTSESERKTILDELKKVQPSIVEGLDKEGAALDVVTQRLQAYNVEMAKRQVLAQYQDAEQEATKNHNEALAAQVSATNDLLKQVDGIVANLDKLSGFEKYGQKHGIYAHFDMSDDEIAALKEKIISIYTDTERTAVEKAKNIAAIFGYTSDLPNLGTTFFRAIDVEGKGLDGLEASMIALFDANKAYTSSLVELKQAQTDVATNSESLGLITDKGVMKTEEATEKLRTWKDAILDIVGQEYDVNITASGNAADAIGTLQKELNAAKSDVDNMKPLLIKVGYSFDTNSWTGEHGKEDDELLTQFNSRNKIVTDLSKLLTPKSTGGDAFVKKLQQQKALIQSAREEYRNLVKYMSSDEAYKKLTEQSAYAKVRLSDIVSPEGDNESYVDYLEGLISKLAGRKTKEAKQMVADLQKEIARIGLEDLSQQANATFQNRKSEELYQQAVAQQVKDAQFNVRQAEIDAMDEGFEKERKQFNLNYDRLIAENKQRQDEWVRALKERRKQEFLTSNPDKTEKDFTLSFTVEDLSSEQKAILAKYEQAANDYLTKAQNDHLSQLLQDYGDYLEQKIEIEKRYQSDIASLRKRADEAGSAEEKNRYLSAADQAERKMREELASVDIEALKKNIDWDSVFGDMSNASTVSISHALAQVQQLFSMNKGNMSASDIHEMTQAIQQMQDELDSRSPFRGLADSFRAIGAAKDDVISALAEYKLARTDLTAAQEEYNAALAEQQAIEEQIKTGEIAEGSERYAKAKERVANAAAKQAKAERQCITAENQAYAANNRLSRAYATFATRLSTIQGHISKVGTNAKNLADIFSTDVADKIGKSIDFIDEVLDAATDVVNALGDAGIAVAGTVSQTVEATSQGMTATAAAGATAISTIEKASVILAVISAALQIATAIANLFNDDDEKQEEIERLQRRIDQLQWELDNADAVRLQKNTFDAIAKVKEVYAEAKQAMYDYYGVSKSWWGRFCVDVVKGNEIMANAVETLATAYADVDYTADKALGTAKFDEAKDNIRNLAEQNLLIQQQINEERAKKKTDHNQIAEWERQMQENAEQMASIINELVEDIIGGSALDIASQLGNTLFDALKEGATDAKKVWREAVDDIVSDIIKRMLITSLIEEPIGKLFNDYKKKWFNEGVFLGVDNLLGTVNDFASDLNEVGESVISLIDQLPDELKQYISGVSGATQDSTKRGFETVDQDSFNEMNGRFASIQMTSEVIKVEVISISDDVKAMRANQVYFREGIDEVATILTASMGHLEDISKHTEKLSEMNDRLEKIEKHTRKL